MQISKDEDNEQDYNKRLDKENNNKNNVHPYERVTKVICLSVLQKFS